MKKSIILLCLIIVSLQLSAVTAINSNKLDHIYGVSFETPVSADEFVTMSLQELQKKTGKKLSLKEKLALRIAKHKIKKIQKKGGDFDQIRGESDGGFNILAFLLGFLLGLIGVLIVYLVWRDKAKTRSAWYGVLVVVILAVLAAVL